MGFFLFSLAKGYSFEQVARKIKTLYPMHIVRAWVAHQQLSDALFYVPRIPQPDPTKVQADTVVAVIGESASAQRWSLLGYQAADTNAPLRALTGLQTIRVMAHGLNTAAALPYLLTGMDAEDSVAQQAPSFLDLAKHAGYKTFVISNSRYHSSAEDFYGVTLRRSADTYLKAGNGAYDEILTAELETALTDPTPRKLIVLHTYGSHFQVEQRYPATHAPFQDPYDNSLHYTSSLLAQWITLLQASAGPQQKVALVYSSDHGVAMPPCADGYHTGSGLSSLQVPLLIWSNDAALTANLPALTSEETLNVRRSNAEFAEFVANSVGYSLHLSPDSKARQLLYQLQPWETVQKLDACTLEPRP